jgi:hypothetical protein
MQAKWQYNSIVSPFGQGYLVPLNVSVADNLVLGRGWTPTSGTGLLAPVEPTLENSIEDVEDADECCPTMNKRLPSATSPSSFVYPSSSASSAM